MVLKGFPRISETFISNEILNLESLGFSIHIISMRHPRETFCHQSVEQIRARVDYLPSAIMENPGALLYHNLLLCLTHPLRYWQGLKRALIRWGRTRKSATVKHLLQAGYVVHRLLPGSGIVHFHAHFAHSPTSVAMFSSLLSGLPFSFFAHAKDIYTSDPRQLREKIGMAAFVVTCTRYNQRHLNALAPAGSSWISCVYHGINPGYFKPPRTQGQPCEPYTLLTVARLTEKKGLRTVYQALAILKARGIRFRHCLIGDGDQKPEILALIRDLDLVQETELLGTLPHDQVIHYYQEADLFVLGCRIAENGDRDGIPNVMAESMAMGLPVVATRVSGIPELLRHETTGLLVEPDNPQALAGAMERLLRDPELRKKVSVMARQTIEAVFDNRVLIQDLAAIYARNMPGLGLQEKEMGA